VVLSQNKNPDLLHGFMVFPDRRLSLSSATRDSLKG
jgi:hypothetical protein